MCGGGVTWSSGISGQDAHKATFTCPCWTRGLGGCGSRERVDQPSWVLSFCPQSCLNKQQVLAAVRQLQQLLKVQETRFAEGLRNVRSRLAALQSSANRVGPDSPPGGSPSPRSGPSPVAFDRASQGGSQASPGLSCWLPALRMSPIPA